MGALPPRDYRNPNRRTAGPGRPRPRQRLAPVHAARAVARRRAAGGRPGRGHVPLVDSRRPPLPRRRLLAVGHRARARRAGDRRRDPRPARPARPHDLPRPDPRAGHRAGRAAAGDRPGRADPGVLRRRRRRQRSRPRSRWPSRPRPSAGEQRPLFVHVAEGYHGDTLGAVSVGGIDAVPRDLPADPAGHPAGLLPRPARARASRGATAPPRWSPSCARCSSARAAAVCAVVVEPMVQAAGGMLTHDAAFLRGVRALCDEFGALMVADEVATGIGRTGRMWAVEHAGVTPDLLTCGKGLTGGLPAAVGRAGDRGGVRGVPRRAERGAHVLPRPHLHRQPAVPARRRSRTST